MFMRENTLRDLIIAASAIVDNFPDSQIEEMSVWGAKLREGRIQRGGLNAENVRNALIELGIFVKKFDKSKTCGLNKP